MADMDTMALLEMSTKALELARSPFDFAAETRLNAIALARDIAPLGWSASGSFSEYQTDYQLVKRELRWRMFCLELGENVFLTFQHAVSRIAEALDSKSRLVLFEPPDRTAIWNMTHRVRAGEVSFVDVIKSLNGDIGPGGSSESDQ